MNAGNRLLKKKAPEFVIPKLKKKLPTQPNIFMRLKASISVIVSLYFRRHSNNPERVHLKWV